MIHNIFSTTFQLLRKSNLCVASAMITLLHLFTIDPTYAQTDPSIDWKVLDTEHFEIIYDAKHEKLARRYAGYAEIAYHDLLPTFREAPKKTVIWINDSTDVANGSATAIPYPTINIFPVLPREGSSIGEYGDWGQELVTHEYTHILTMQHVHGFMSVLRLIFGSIVVPNAVTPRWWLEGIAVEEESRHSHHGRMRSMTQQAWLRALVEERKLLQEDISRVNELSIPDELAGQRPYLLGPLIWDEIIRMKGNDAVLKLHEHHGRRVPTWLPNTPPEELTGKSYQDFLQRAYQRIQIRTSKQIQAIRKKGVMDLNAFYPIDSSKHNISHKFATRISPDKKKMILVHSTGRGQEIELLTRQNGNFSPKTAKSLSRTMRTQSLNWHPNSKAFVYDQVLPYDRFYLFSDLRLYNFETEKSERLTTGLRARDPSFSPDGQKIAFIQVEADQNTLNWMSPKTKKVQVLYRPPAGVRLSKPEFLSQHQIIFSQRDLSGDESLYIVSVKNKTRRKILSAFQPATRPRRTSAGLLFVSARSGIPNLYLANRQLDSARAVTNVTTAVQEGEWDPVQKDFYITRITSRGPQVFQIQNPKKYKLSKIPPTINYQRPTYKKPDIEIDQKISDYWGSTYLRPRYWFPNISTSANGVLLQASTAGRDPVGHHAYSGTLGLDTGTSELDYGVSYTNRLTPITLTGVATRINDLFLESSSTVRTRTNYTLLGAYSWPSLPSWSFAGGWRYRDTEIDTITTDFSRSGPTARVQYNSPETQFQHRQAISPNQGGSFSVSVTSYLESAGAQDFDEWSLNATKYLGDGFLPNRHSLVGALRAVYAPDNDQLLLGASTAGGNFQNSLIAHQLLLRGYASGSFIAQNALNATLEYHFPIAEIHQGSGLFPLFSRRLHGRLLVDAITLDGVFFNETLDRFQLTDMGDYFYGVGGELHWETTIAYHLPLTLILGGYYGTDTDATGGFRIFTGFGFSGF